MAMAKAKKPRSQGEAILVRGVEPNPMVIDNLNMSKRACIFDDGGIFTSTDPIITTVEFWREYTPFDRCFTPRFFKAAAKRGKTIYLIEAAPSKNLSDLMRMQDPLELYAAKKRLHWIVTDEDSSDEEKAFGIAKVLADGPAKMLCENIKTTSDFSKSFYEIGNYLAQELIDDFEPIVKGLDASIYKQAFKNDRYNTVSLLMFNDMLEDEEEAASAPVSAAAAE